MSILVTTRGGGNGGGLTPQILVTAPSGSVLTCGTQTYTLGADETQHTFVLSVLGAYVVTASKDGKTTTETVLVDAIGIYKITLYPERLYLYKHGDECTDITGGWDNTGYIVTNVTVNKATNYNGVISATVSTTGVINMLGTVNPINTNGYSKLCVSVVSVGGTYGIDVRQTKQKSYYTTTTNNYAMQKFYNTGVASLDITKAEQSYIGLSAIYNANFVVDEVWLE